jgi:hypothetical protein
MTNPSPLAKVPPNIQQANTSLTLAVRNVSDLHALARIFAQSGMFGAVNDQTIAKCSIQLLAGMEAGFTPFASITGIYVVNGRPGFSAQLLAQSIKRHPRYDYRVRDKTAEQCRIEFFQDGQSCGVETFTLEMANRAGLISGRGPWKQYPEAMLFARCLTAGMRTHCPDALGGHTPYTPEELGAQNVDADGMVTVTDVTPTAAPKPMDRDTMQRQALHNLTDAGLSTEAIPVMLRELGGESCTALGMLPDQYLKVLAERGAKAEKITAWNDAAAEQAESDELPLVWDAENAA